MTIGIGQLLFISFFIFLFFGNISTIFKDFAQAIKVFHETLKDKYKN